MTTGNPVFSVDDIQ